MGTRGWAVAGFATIVGVAALGAATIAARQDAGDARDLHSVCAMV